MSEAVKIARFAAKRCKCWAQSFVRRRPKREVSMSNERPKAAILSDASSAFAPRRPAPVEKVRRNQMEEFGLVQDGIFKSADKRFHRLGDVPGERLDTLMTVYALKHRSDFASALSSEAG